MRLPWVGRTAYDLLVDERDRLRAQVDRLTDDIVRLQRARHGLREAPRQPRKHEDEETIPHEIRELIVGFQSKAAQAETERQVRESRKAGTPWTEIRRVLEDQLLEPSEP